MVKKLFVLGLCAAVLMVSSLAFAADVYVTKRGKKYHSAVCGLIASKEKSTMDEQQAIAKGMKACNKCLKDKASATEEEQK